MNIGKWISLPFVILIQIFFFSLASAESYPQAFPTNHFMAYNIAFTPTGDIVTGGTVANLVAQLNGVCYFKSLDQFTCNPGKSEIKLQITNSIDNRIIAAAQPFSLNAPYKGYIHTQIAEWQVLFPSIGWYRYEILVNNQPIAYYYFVVSYAINP